MISSTIENIKRGLEVMVFCYAMSICCYCLASEFTNSVCKPTTTPVATCNCPVAPGAPIIDRCEGTLPVAGSQYYGDVACMPQGTVSCYSSSGNSNACGRVVKCDCIADCNTPIMFLGCGCQVFEDKPHCQSTWGQCQWSQAKI